MKLKPLILAVLCAVGLHCAVSAQDYLSRVSIAVSPNNKQKFSEVLGLLEIDHFQVDENGHLLAEIGQREMSVLRKSGIPHKVLIDDMRAWLKRDHEQYMAKKARGEIQQERMALDGVNKLVNNLIVTPTAFEVKPTFGGYYSYLEMVTAIDNLVAAYPTIAQKILVGTSALGRSIWSVKISDNVATGDATEPDVLYMGLQHAREAITGSSMIFFMQYLCEQYTADPRIKSLVDAREIYITPVVNPDGWEFNRTSGGVGTGWRKNRRTIGANIGVDLNRNYSVDWNTCGSVTCGTAASCGSTSGSSDTYIGPSAFSEPETQAIRNFCTTGGRNFVAAIDQHAFGPYYSLPYGKTARVLTALEDSFFRYVPALMGQYNGMRAGNSCESVGYEVAGGVKDWWLIGDIGTGSKGKVWGMTGEGGAGGGTGGTFGSFWAPSSQIVNLCKGMTFQNLQLAYAAGSYVDIQDISDIAVNSLTGSFNFSLLRVGLENQPVTVSIVPIENIQSTGAPITVNSLTTYFSRYGGSMAYTLPGALTPGQRLTFAWKIETGGYTYYDTVVKFYQPITIFSDDMETTNTNWTFSGGWGYQTGLAFQGSRSISESPSGNYPTNVTGTTRMAVYNSTLNPINLTGATGAYLSFWVRHRAENFRDLLRVEVSTNGTTWTAIPGTTTVQEPGTLDGAQVNGLPALTGIREQWTRELFDLRSYLNTANLRLRFRFTSDTDPTGFDFQVDQGFNIDNVKIVKTNTTFVNLVPVNFLAFNGRMMPDKTIKLDWDVAREINHDYYDIEKSTDGITFTSIGRYVGIGPYYFVDENPNEGNNFYRIRQVDKDRNFTLSKTINVVYHSQSLSLRIFPNPIRDAINVEFNGPVRTKVHVLVTDMMGRTFHQQSVTLNGSARNIKIDAGSWPSQQYVVKVTNDAGETLTVEKIVK